MLFTEDSIAKKWRTLRTQYATECKKISNSQKSGMGTDERYLSKWKLFSLLGILRDHVNLNGKETTVSNLSVSI